MFFRRNTLKKVIVIFGIIYIGIHCLKRFYHDEWEVKTSHLEKERQFNFPKYIQTTSGNIRVCTQEERRNYIQEQCRNMPSNIQNRKPILERLLVDHEHKLVYCVIPKAACTTWKGIMANKTSKGFNKFGTKKHWRFPDLVFSPGYLHSCGLDYVRDNYTDYWNSTYSHYTKFIVVRDPFQRVLSAYYDKLRDSTPLIPFLRLMREKFNKTGIIPFRDFIHFLITPGYGHRADIHWTTYHSLCFPCQINYDYILRVETMEYDQNLILPLLGAQRKKPLPKLNLSPNSNRTFTDKTDHFDDYKSIALSELNLLLNRYYKDSKTFGYDFDLQTRSSKCEIKTQTGDTCC